MLSAPLIDAVARAFGPNPPEKMAVAASGGGDSTALLSIMAKYAKALSIDLHVITVDHGLRKGFAQEAAVVTDLCLKLGLPHHLEYWSGWNGTGNLQASARSARYGLIADWAFANDIEHVALAHTADDQAETVLMRLGRAAGVDGLSAMPVRHVKNGVTWLRPFLNTRRQTLRVYLQATGLTWADDPSNADRSFERVRCRDALTVLETLGIGTDALVTVAKHMREAREALGWQTFLIARELVEIRAGAVAIALPRFRAQPIEIKRRILLHTLMWLSSSAYPARGEAVMRLLEAVNIRKGMTLEGCRVSIHGNRVWMYRELNAVADLSVPVGELWDNRWMMDGPLGDPDLQVRALGEEPLSEVEGWRALEIPKAALAVTPAVWQGNTLIAAPLVIEDDEWLAEVEGGSDGFFAALLSH